MYSWGAPAARRARCGTRAQAPGDATALLFDPGGETLHVACAGAEVCVAHCRVAQGTTPSGDVRARFVVDDVTPSPRPAPSPGWRLSGRSRARTSQSLTAPSASCARFRKPAVRRRARRPGRRGALLRRPVLFRRERDNERVFEKTNASSESRVFVIPDTAGASAVASDVSASASASAERKAYVAVASPGAQTRRRVRGAPFVDDSRRSDGGVRHRRGHHSGPRAPRARDDMARRDAGNSTPRGAVAVARRRRVQRPSPALSETRRFRRPSRRAPSARARRRARRAAPRRRARAVLPTKPCSDRIRSDRARMKPKTTAARRRRRPRRRRWRWRRGAVAGGAAVAAPTPADVSIVARAPDGMLLRVWLHGEAEDEDEDEDDADADRGTASASANAPAVFVLDDASKMEIFSRVRNLLPLRARFRSRWPRRGAEPEKSSRAPWTSPASRLGTATCWRSGCPATARAKPRRSENRGEPRNAPADRRRPRRGAREGDDRNDAMENRDRDPASFSCPASASALLAARGGTLELYRARSTRERVVALAVAGRLEEAVALADARRGRSPTYV